MLQVVDVTLYETTAMRLRKSLKILPGVRVNLSKSGVSTSIGPKGATINVGKKGIRSTLSVPGTGLFWSSNSGWSKNNDLKPAVEIEKLRQTASKAIGIATKEAEKLNSIGERVDRAIETLNNGKGLTFSKIQTFEKRVLSEESKVFDLEQKVREQRQFLEAIHSRLEAMRFGFFGGGDKRMRDQVSDAVANCVDEAKRIETQLSSAHRALSEKLSEVQDKWDGA